MRQDAVEVGIEPAGALEGGGEFFGRGFVVEACEEAPAVGDERHAALALGVVFGQPYRASVGPELQQKGGERGAKARVVHFGRFLASAGAEALFHLMREAGAAAHGFQPQALRAEGVGAGDLA